MLPARTHTPTPVLVTAVAPVEFGITPPSVLLPVFVPSRVSVFTPLPVAVRLELNVTGPLPEAITVPPPVVPARLSTRSVLAVVPV